MNNKVEHKTIKTKDIYIFESHHYALFPWSKLRCELEEAPILLSLDHHTDTHEPFLRECSKPYKFEYDKELSKKLVGKIDYRKEQSISEAIDRLKNDEHIKTAIEANILSKALIISYNNRRDFPQSYEEKNKVDNHQKIILERIMGNDLQELNIKRPYTYPKSDIYIPEISLQRFDLSNEELFNLAIESEFLKEKFDIFNHMCPETVLDDYSINKKYILDIDLDYFHTLKSIRPEDIHFFKILVKNAEIITIALEEACISLLKDEFQIKDDVTSKVLLEELLAHIYEALK